jgi:hypothetical protein
MEKLPTITKIGPAGAPFQKGATLPSPFLIEVQTLDKGPAALVLTHTAAAELAEALAIYLQAHRFQ